MRIIKFKVKSQLGHLPTMCPGTGYVISLTSEVSTVKINKSCHLFTDH